MLTGVHLRGLTCILPYVLFACKEQAFFKQYPAFGLSFCKTICLITYKSLKACLN